MDIAHQYGQKLGFERKIQEQQVQLKKLIFQVKNLSDYLGSLVADSFQTKIVENEKLILANILDNHPDIAERVATHIQQATVNKRVEKPKIESSSHDMGYGDIVGLDLGQP